MWHLYLQGTAQTTIEDSDNKFYRALAAKKGKTFHNTYDLGVTRNLQHFFACGPQQRSFFTLLLPIACAPNYTDGYTWIKRRGCSSALELNEELTDDSDSGQIAPLDADTVKRI